jgi:serine phosphatase RsbU (regulator of sigma subunit)
VLETGEPTRWVLDEGDLDLKDTRHRFGIQAAIAVPMVGPRSFRGVLYADRRRDDRSYSDEDVEILTAAATAVMMRRAVTQSALETQKAAKIQRSMLPRELPSVPGYELEAGLHMCHGVGGDLYDCVCRGDRRCLFSVGDVSGKGLPAALIMGATSYLVRALAELELPPLEIYQRVHSNLLAKYRMRQYVALFLGELDQETGRVACVVAGVPRPLLIRTDGSTERLPVTAFAAALIDLDDPPPTEFEAQLEPGDLLAVFTDGYPEATPDGNTFLENAVEEQLVRDHDLPLHEIRARLDHTVDTFVGKAGPSDDRTLMLVRRCSARG